MRNQLIIVISLILTTFLLFLSCAAKNPKGNPGGNNVTTDKSLLFSHLETLQVRYDLTETLKTKEMKVTIREANRDPEELRELLWYKKTEDGSNLLQIQALGAFNDPRAVAIANRDQFLLVLVDEHEGYLGELSDGVLRKIFGIDLRVSDVYSAIFANPFLDGRTENIEVNRSGNKFIVSRPGVEAGHTEIITILIHQNEPQITEWRIVNEKGKLQQRVFFSHYKEVNGILRPHRVEISRPSEKTKVEVKIGKVEMNVDISDSKFDIEPFLESDINILPFSDLPELDDSQ